MVRASARTIHNCWLSGPIRRMRALASTVWTATATQPREGHRKGGSQWISVQHNQNANLRPNDKMIRSVCRHCHGLRFSIDALADPALVGNNFRGQASHHIASIDWALQRVKTEQPKA